MTERKIICSRIKENIKMLLSVCNKKHGEIYQCIYVGKFMIAGSRYLTVKINDDLGLGEFCIDASRLSSAVSSFPKDCEISFILSDGFLELKGKGRKYKISLINSMYPLRDEREEYEDINANSQFFINSIKKASYAVNVNDARPYLQGVCIDGGFVGTDGYKTCFISDEDIETISKPIVPLDFIKILPVVCDNGKFKLSNRSIKFDSGNIEITSNLIDGIFPDIRRAIPKNEIDISVNRIDLIEAVSTCRNVGLSDILSITGENGSLLIKSEKIQKDSASASIEYHGEDFRTGFNAIYLVSALKSIESTEVKIKVNKDNSHLLLIDNETIHIITKVFL